MTQTELEALQEAIRVAGTQKALASLLGINEAAISQWKHSRVPGLRVIAIEKATGVRRERLRPDLYPDDEVPGQASSD